MTHAEYLRQTVAEIAEEVPGFEQMNPEAQQNLRELAEEYFHDEFVPRLEGMINIPRYEAAMHEKTEQDREFIADQIGYLRSSMIKAQRAAYQHLMEKFSS